MVERYNDSITVDELKSLFSYESVSGIFIRKTTKASYKKGSIAGSINKKGYSRIGINGKSYAAHRLAWLYVYGEFPKGEIDHINHSKTDNRIENLREVDQYENSRNKPMTSLNKSGVFGVHWSRHRSRWCAMIKIDTVQKNLGSFIEFSDAVNARKNAEVLYGFHENHGRSE